MKFVDELWEDEHVAANKYFTEYEHPLLGPIAAPSPIVRMSKTPTRIQRASPALGEHNDELLGELGYDTTQIAALRDAGAIR